MKINFCSPINNTGYGIASLNILKELSGLADITYLPIGQPGVNSREDYEIISSLFSKKSHPNIYSPYFKIWHQFDLFDHYGKGKYFAYPFFELDTFNHYEIESLKVPDVICVSSEWAKSIIKSNILNVDCCVVPLGVDRNIFHENIEPQTKSDKYIFLNIGKWEIRKGHDILLELFNKAFPEEKDVELWILASEVTNSYSSKEELEKWKSLYNQPRIKLFNGVQSHKDIAQLISNCDCGLYPSRAEGWNLELLETMSMNKPVIATNYSAHTEFCNKDNSYLIDIITTEKAYDGKAFVGQGNWAKIEEQQKDQIIDYMRFVYKNKITTNINGVETAKKYSWANSANEILRCIKEYV